MGRTNKLVDGCYSYWQGAAFPLLQQLLEQQQVKQPHDSQQAQRREEAEKRSSPSDRSAAPLGDPAAAQAAVAAAVAAVTKHLLSGAAEALVEGLPPALAPVEVSQAALAQAQQQLEDVVDQSLQVGAQQLALWTVCLRTRAACVHGISRGQEALEVLLMLQILLIACRRCC